MIALPIVMRSQSLQDELQDQYVLLACNITQNIVLLKYKYDKDFVDFVRMFVVPMNQTKAEARALVETCGNNIFQADIWDDIAWALVKLI